MQCATHVFRGLRSSDGRRQAPRTAQNPFNTSHLAKTYTKPYTVTHYPCPGRKSPEIQDVTISRKALKIRCPKGRPGSTPGPGTCDSSDLGRDRGGRWGRVSPNVSPIAFATLRVRPQSSCRHREPRELAGRAPA